MKIFQYADKLKTYITSQKKLGKTIGFVPTMGALHAGHMSLIEQSIQNTDITVCSIFVNPTQFGETRDLSKYPRTVDSDIKKLEQNGCSSRGLRGPAITKEWLKSYTDYLVL